MLEGTELRIEEVELSSCLVNLRDVHVRFLAGLVASSEVTATPAGRT